MKCAIGIPLSIFVENLFVFFSWIIGSTRQLIASIYEISGRRLAIPCINSSNDKADFHLVFITDVDIIYISIHGYLHIKVC